MTENEPTMTDDLLLDSLRRRMAAMPTHWYDAVDTMGPEHVNHFERDGVLPIAFSLFHYSNMQDTTFAVLDALESWWHQHGMRHPGEIELARGLVGLGGMTS